MVERVKNVKGVVDVDTSMNVGKPELSVQVDRPKAADLGVQIGDAAEALRLLVGGDQVTTYNEGGEQYEVHLRARAENRSTQAAIAGLTVPSSRLGSVALDNVATFAPGTAPSDINRLARQRQVTVFCNLLPSASQAEVQNAMLAEFRTLNTGGDYRGAFTGRSRELGRAAQNFVLAFVLSLVFMYLILAAQFESWLHPITILLSLPLTLPFALLSIIIFQQSLNIFSALGLLVLFGVVKKNSILQIDHANQLKDTGLSTHDAVVRASRDRLRPILMTTFAFVAGMIPLIVSRGIGAGTNHAIGFVIFGGQSLALLLTLVVTPVAYSLFDDASKVRIFGRRRRIAEPGRPRDRRPVGRPGAAMRALALLVALRALGLAATVSAQTPATAPATLRLTVDEAVKMALDNNVDLKADRLDPQISDTRVAAAAGAFRPTINSSVNSNNQLLPPASLLAPVATRTDVMTETAGVGQKLPWFGTSYNVGWTTSHTNSNSFLNSYNPLLQSGLSLNVSQPLIRDLFIDAARQQLAVSRTNRDIADTRLRESLVHTTANVKAAYWNLVSARATVDARRSALDLAQELVRVNKAKVDVGSSPPLDLVSAQAEVAADQEQLIIAETSVKQAEDRLRLLIFDTVGARELERQHRRGRFAADRDDGAWTSRRRSRARWRSAPICCARARTSRTRRRAVKFAANQRLPDVRLNASYQASGLGGTQVLRTGGFPGTIVGPGDITELRLGARPAVRARLPDVGRRRQRLVPDRRSTEQANDARAKLERSQSEERLKSARGARDSAGARRRVEDRDEREADRDHARGARARRAAARRRAQAVRGRHVDELPGDSGAARSRAGEDQRARRRARVRPVARGFRGAAGRRDQRSGRDRPAASARRAARDGSGGAQTRQRARWRTQARGFGTARLTRSSTARRSSRVEGHRASD